MEENKTLKEAREAHFIEVLRSMNVEALRQENDKLRADLDYISIMSGVEIPVDEEEKR